MIVVGSTRCVVTLELNRWIVSHRSIYEWIMRRQRLATTCCEAAFRLEDKILMDRDFASRVFYVGSFFLFSATGTKFGRCHSHCRAITDDEKSVDFSRAISRYKIFATASNDYPSRAGRSHYDSFDSRDKFFLGNACTKKLSRVLLYVGTKI